MPSVSMAAGFERLRKSPGRAGILIYLRVLVGGPMTLVFASLCNMAQISTSQGSEVVGSLRSVRQRWPIMPLPRSRVLSVAHCTHSTKESKIVSQVVKIATHLRMAAVEIADSGNPPNRLGSRSS
ncbi:hypothetical protein BJX65DRAFT_66861 [Aspergillus insuetus]